MTAPDVDAIRARADRATEGPWAWASRTTADGDEWAVFDPTDHALASNRDGWAPDAEFIAHAREDVPALLAEVERLRVERDQAREECGHAKAMRKFASEELDQFIAAKNRAEATIARVQKVMNSPEVVNIHMGGGNLVGQKKVIFPEHLRAAIEGTDS